jgi:SET domain-containing protein
MDHIIQGKIIYKCFKEKSQVHGHGTFAGEEILKRTKIGELAGKVVSIKKIPVTFSLNSSIAIVELDDLYALDSRQFKNTLCFINHSCTPNCYMRVRNFAVEIYALTSIRKSAELTLDYGYTHHEGKRVCHCGVKNCRGWI